MQKRKPIHSFQVRRTAAFEFRILNVELLYSGISMQHPFKI